MTKQEKLNMIKQAISDCSDPKLDPKAKERGMKSLKDAYRRHSQALN